MKMRKLRMRPKRLTYYMGGGDYVVGWWWYSKGEEKLSADYWVWVASW